VSLDCVERPRRAWVNEAVFKLIPWDAVLENMFFYLPYRSLSLRVYIYIPWVCPWESERRFGNHIYLSETIFTPQMPIFTPQMPIFTSQMPIFTTHASLFPLVLLCSILASIFLLLSVQHQSLSMRVCQGKALPTRISLLSLVDENLHLSFHWSWCLP
jgi:hypothetical protein